MKKISLILTILVSIAFTSNAQKAKVQSAYNYLKFGQLNKAKYAIDEACENASTANYAKAWYYKGKVYYSIAVSEDADYKDLDPNAIEVAYSSYLKAKEFDTKKEFEDELNASIAQCADGFFNQAINAFQKKTFAKAGDLFYKAYNMYETSDKTSKYSYNSALYAIIAYSEVKDTLKAQELLDKSLVNFSDSLNLVLQQINIYLQTNKSDKANELLKKAIEKDPKNPSLHFAIGTTFEKQNNIDEAEKAYLKAIEIKPDFFDAIFNVGALLFNKGVVLLKEAEDKFDPTNPNANSDLELKYKAEWNKAQPYLEKALELQPNDQPTLLTLKALYNRTNQSVKYDAIKDRINK